MRGFFFWLILAILLISGCLQASSPSLTFTTAPCDQTINPYSPPQAAVTDQRWVDEKTLSIEGYVKTWCSGGKITGSFTIDGNNLNLLYSVIADGPVTTCLCAHNVTYTLSNLKHRTYAISLNGGG